MNLLEKNKLIKESVHQYRLLRYRYLQLIDQMRGPDFTRAVSVEELNLDPQLSRMYYASTPHIKRIFKKLHITMDDSILDIGCGKGRAMYYMSKFPFRSIAGVEISPMLCEIAQSNFKKLHEVRCDIYLQDALVFQDYDQYNYIYFYNPFSEEVLYQCMQYIQQSIIRLPRKVIIIYHNPVYSQAIEQSGFTLVQRQHFDRFFIYQNIDTLL